MIKKLTLFFYIVAFVCILSPMEIEKTTTYNFSKLPAEIANYIMQFVIEEELAKSWNNMHDQKEIPRLDRLKKYFVYLSAQQTLDNQQNYILFPEQIKHYLEQLAYKISALYAQQLGISEIFLIKIFYKGENKQNLLNTMKEKSLSELQSKTIQEYIHPLMEYRVNTLGGLIGLRKIQINSDCCCNNFANRLDLSRKEIKNLQGFECYHFKELKKLFLDLNQLKEVPTNFGCNCSMLIKLNLACNALENLPEEFGKYLPNLIELYLYTNKLENLPKKFGEYFQNLTTLFLGQNRLKDLPQSFEKLSKLTMLSLSGNQLGDDLKIEIFVKLNQNFSMLCFDNNKFSEEKKAEIKKTLGDRHYQL